MIDISYLDISIVDTIGPLLGFIGTIGTAIMGGISATKSLVGTGMKIAGAFGGDDEQQVDVSEGGNPMSGGAFGVAPPPQMAPLGGQQQPIQPPQGAGYLDPYGKKPGGY